MDNIENNLLKLVIEKELNEDFELVKSIFHTYARIKMDSPLTEEVEAIVKSINKKRAKNSPREKESRIVLKVKADSLPRFVKLMREFSFINISISDVMNMQGDNMYIVAMASKEENVRALIRDINFPGVKIFDTNKQNFT